MEQTGAAREWLLMGVGVLLRVVKMFWKWTTILAHNSKNALKSTESHTATGRISWDVSYTLIKLFEKAKIALWGVTAGLLVLGCGAVHAQIWHWSPASRPAAV